MRKVAESVDINAALARAAAELEDAEAQFRAAENRVRELVMMRDGLQLALERYAVRDADQGTGGEQEAATPKPGADAIVGSPGRPSLPPARGQAVSQTDLAFDALRALGRPGDTDEVMALTTAAGYPFNREQVRAALAHLRRTGRIKRVAPGMWDAPRKASTPDDVAPAAGTAGAIRTGENGTSSQVGVLTGADLHHNQ